MNRLERSTLSKISLSSIFDLNLPRISFRLNKTSINKNNSKTTVQTQKCISFHSIKNKNYGIIFRYFLFLVRNNLRAFMFISFEFVLSIHCIQHMNGSKWNQFPYVSVRIVEISQFSSVLSSFGQISDFQNLIYLLSHIERCKLHLKHKKKWNEEANSFILLGSVLCHYIKWNIL